MKTTSNTGNSGSRRKQTSIYFDDSTRDFLEGLDCKTLSAAVRQVVDEARAQAKARANLGLMNPERFVRKSRR